MYCLLLEITTTTMLRNLCPSFPNHLPRLPLGPCLVGTRGTGKAPSNTGEFMVHLGREQTCSFISVTSGCVNTCLREEASTTNMGHSSYPFILSENIYWTLMMLQIDSCMWDSKIKHVKKFFSIPKELAVRSQGKNMTFVETCAQSYLCLLPAE